jgi:Yip1 domain
VTAGSRALQARVVGILTHPAAEWPVIAGERTDAQTLMLGYAAPLAAIPAVCRWIGLSMIGWWLPLAGTYRVGIVRGFVSAVVSWIFALAAIYVAAVVIEKLAPTFKSSGGMLPALKLVAYASTPVWIVGVLNLVPAFAPLTLLAALYGGYLFSLGLPVVMHTPDDQVIPYVFVATIVTIVVFMALGFVAGAIAGVGGYPVV